MSCCAGNRAARGAGASTAYASVGISNGTGLFSGGHAENTGGPESPAALRPTVRASGGRGCRRTESELVPQFSGAACGATSRTPPGRHARPLQFLVTPAASACLVARGRLSRSGELKALADFYGSPVGKAAMKKQAAYMADAMPIIQMEVAKAQLKARREMTAAAE